MEAVSILDHPNKDGTQDKNGKPQVTFRGDDGRPYTFLVEDYKIERAVGAIQACYVTVSVLTTDIVVTHNSNDTT